MSKFVISHSNCKLKQRFCAILTELKPRGTQNLFERALSPLNRKAPQRASSANLLQGGGRGGIKFGREIFHSSWLQFVS